ncbi:Fur family transcriptional regulator [Weissella kandleri]|nr:Fur family transcriptional regulator [Weissella kandleri]
MSRRVEKALEQLRQAGFKLTAQRSTIIKYLVENKMFPKHPTADAIYNDLNAAGCSISRATVYNTLEALVSAHLVLAIDNNMDGKMHYDWFGTPHYHVICTNCGKIVDADNFAMQDLSQLAQAATGFQISSYQVEVRGLCPDCQKLLAQDQESK